MNIGTAAKNIPTAEAKYCFRNKFFNLFAKAENEAKKKGRSRITKILIGRMIAINPRIKKAKINSLDLLLITQRCAMFKKHATMEKE